MEKNIKKEKIQSPTLEIEIWTWADKPSELQQCES